MKNIMGPVLIVSLLLVGCVQKRILDDVNLETGSAYDYVDGKIRGTVLVPVYLPDQAVENKTFTASSDQSRDFLRDIQRQSSDPMVTGSLKVVLFGEQLAKKRGILDLMDSFQRDPSIGAGLYLAVTEGESKEFLEGNYGKRGNSVYLTNLIKHNMKTKDVPKTNLQRFLFDFNQLGKTPYLPSLKKFGDEQIEISGISFFRYGHVVYSIPAEKMFFFKLLVDDYSQGTLKITLDKESAVIESIRSKFKMKLTSRDPLTVNVRIKLNAVLKEYSGKKVSPKKIREVESKVEKNIESECQNLIKEFKEKNIDPVGFGHFIKSKTRNFSFSKWKTDYPNLKVNVHADVTIMESGVIE
ncbi:Ger(x)C family spore germination protein [Bacillus salipaludis]|uniref:Ger(x)C family spore germination protein n=1 Tax=Bacillus salipaludis TaxID=2547811 RepID=UPI002E24BCD9|nr:Ger(x)C family spore germination protein [Bacillus salipaludis]